MQELAKSDIFFVVTTVAVITLLVVFFIAFVYVIRILRDMKYIARRAREEGERILDDVEEARRGIKKEGLGARRLFTAFKKIFLRTKRHK